MCRPPPTTEQTIAPISAGPMKRVLCSLSLSTDATRAHAPCNVACPSHACPVVSPRPNAVHQHLQDNTPGVQQANTTARLAPSYFQTCCCCGCCHMCQWSTYCSIERWWTGRSSPPAVPIAGACHWVSFTLLRMPGAAVPSCRQL